MQKVRIGLVGTGGIGQIHLGYLQDVARAEVTAVCDNRKVVVKAVARKYGVRAFTDPDDLIASGLVDAVMICTPHYFHPTVAIAAAKAGLHALTEKPMAVRTSDARKMIATAEKHKVQLAVMFQRRTESLWRKAREIIASGALGKLIRTCMMESHYRTQAYYDSGGWRGTWKDEGGGVMMNQAPHSLDLFVWLGGMPSKVVGRCDTRGHDVEVPDTALAVLDYPNGAVGTLYTSTTEFPEMSFFQFVGESGVLEVRDGHMRLGLSAPPAGEMSRTSEEPWDIPQVAWRDFDLVEEEMRHRHITENFIAAILDGAPLVAPGEEGALSLELANAVTVSSAISAEVAFPLKPRLFDDVLDRYIRTAKGKKKKTSNKVVIPKR